MSSLVRQPNRSGESVTTFPDLSDLQFQVKSPALRAAGGLAAFSFEFVAKPDKAASAPLVLSAAIQSGLEDVVGFSGSLVMASDSEARLVTVIIFWEASEAAENRDRSLRRVRALLAPYLDRCLRTQHMVAHLPTQQNSQVSSIDTPFIADESVAQ